jgi:hypothetical protein
MRRTVRRIVLRTEICNGNRERMRNLFLPTDNLVVWQFQSFGRKQRRMRAWHCDPAMPPVVLLRSPDEVERWLAELPQHR